jgi:hypothetical protein
MQLRKLDFRMTFGVLLLFAAGAPICAGQNVDMTQVCEQAASSSGLDDAAQAEMRNACMQAAACSASCNSIINDGEAYTACVQKCIVPADAAAKVKSSDKDSSEKKNAKGDLCKEAGDFRDHQLFQLWDTEEKKYEIFTDGSNQQVALRDKTAKLMDDEWWAGSTGADAAIEIKAFTDVVNDAIGIFVPEAEAAQIGTSAIHHAREIADGVTSIGVLETYAKDNADAAEKQAGTEIFAKYGGPIGSATKLLIDTADYAKTKDSAEQYRQTVQDQVRKINETLKSLDEKRKAAVDKMDAYQQIVTGIDMMCANKTSSPAPTLTSPD